MFISFLYMFRATMCPSLGKITIYTTLRICTLHTPVYQTVIYTE